MVIEIQNETIATEACISEDPQRDGRYQINFRVPQGTYKGTFDEWKLESAKLPKGIYICMNCGKVNGHFKYTCENCEDPRGGDGEDD